MTALRMISSLVMLGRFPLGKVAMDKSDSGPFGEEFALDCACTCADELASFNASDCWEFMLAGDVGGALALLVCALTPFSSDPFDSSLGICPLECIYS